MAEFHKNQIAWDTPEAKKVTLAKPDYGYVADALDNLADKAARVANTERVRLDDSIKADLDHEVELINQDLDNMRSATGDFDGFENEAINRLHNVLANYDEDTRRRFLSKNPYYINNTRLATKEKILERKRAIFENEVENNLPLWTSQAAMIGTPEARQDVIHKIQESLGNLSYETTVSDMIFKANQMFDKYNAYRLVTRGDKDSLLEAKKFLASPETSVTIDPYTRVRLEKEINDELIELAKPKKKEANPYAIAFEKAYADLMLQNTPQASAKAKYMYEQLINSPKKVINTSEDGNTILIDGKPLPLYFDLQGMDSTERFALAKDIKNKYGPFDANEQMAAIDYSIDVDKALTDFNIGVSNKTSDASAAVKQLESMLDDTTRFNELPGNVQKEVRQAVRDYNKTKTNVMTENAYPFRSSSWSPLSPAKREYYDRDLVDVLKSQMGYRAAAERLEEQINSGAVFLDVPETKKIGSTLLNAITPIREEYYKDIEDNTAGEFALMLWKQMSDAQQAGMLSDTRFEATQDTYTNIFDGLIGSLRADGTLSNKVVSEDIDGFKTFLKSMLGVDAKPTEKEQDLVDSFVGNAAASQTGAGAGWFSTLIDKYAPWGSHRNVKPLHIPTNANPNPELTTFKVTNQLYGRNTKVQKALKETK